MTDFNKKRQKTSKKKNCKYNKYHIETYLKLTNKKKLIETETNIKIV